MLLHQGTKIIKTERLVLRPFTVDDAKKMFDNWANDSRVTRFLTWQPHGTVDVTVNLLSLWCEEYKNRLLTTTGRLNTTASLSVEFPSYAFPKKATGLSLVTL